MLKGLIRSRATRKIMTLIFSNPDEKFYIRQLERLSGEPVNAVRRELTILEKSGFLLSKKEGNVKYFWPNKRNPIFEDLKRIIMKTEAVGNVLRQLLKATRGVRVAFIYGSVASNEENAASDIDIMVIGNVDSVTLHREIGKIEDKIKRTVNYSLVSVAELRGRKTDFIKRVLTGKKLFIVGDENELKKLAG